METDTDFRVDRVLTGGGMNSYGAFLSGGRMGMVKPQNGQYMPTLDAEPRQLLSGTERDHAEATWDIRIESDEPVLVIDIIEKYREDMDKVHTNSESIIVYKNLHTLAIGSVTVPRYMTHHTTFGFTLVERTKVAIGDELPPNCIISHGPSRAKDDNHKIGRECNTAYFGMFGTNEDGAIASMDIKNMFQSEIITETEIYVENNATLLNYFGDENYYKPIPSIGDRIGARGIIAVKRELQNNFKLLNTSNRSLSTIQHPFDLPIHNYGGAEVIDITVIKGKKVKLDNLPAGLVTYLDALANNRKRQYERILELDKKQLLEAHRNGRTYTRDPSWHITVRDAERIIGERIPNKPEPSGTRTDTVISGYYIKIVTRKVMTPKLGHKFTGNQAEKFVICSFSPKEDMPTDKWGRHALFAVNPVGVSNRNNPGQLFATFNTDACFHTRLQLLEMRKQGKSDDELWDYLVEFYRLISDYTYNLVKELPESQRLAHLNTVLTNRIDLQDEIGAEYLGYISMRRLKGTPYYPPRDVVTFRDGGGNMKTSRNKVRISNKYIYPMEKIGSHSSACNIPLRQSTGFPAKHSSRLKKYAPMSTQASRCYGESEFRDIISKLGIKAAKLIMNLNSNAQATKLMADQLLSKAGFVNMSDAPKYTGRGLSILRHLMSCFGHKLVNIKPDEEHVSVQEKVDKLK